MADYRCTNCGNIQDVEVTETTIDNEDETTTVKSSTENCTRCGWAHWEDI